MSHRIGLRSTGLVVFGGRVFSAFTGLLFLIMATRWLAPAQLGLWEVIISLVTFSSFPVGIVSYWATRDIARGRLVGRTAFVTGFAISGLGLLFYFVTSILTRSSLAVSIVPFLLGSLLVPLNYLNAVANSIIVGYRPVVSGYQLMVSEPVKIVVAYEALYVYGLGIEGVILALLISYLITSSFGAYMVRGATKEQLQLSVARRWIGLSWLPVLDNIPPLLLNADTYVAAIGFGTVVAGIYQPAFTVASIVGYSYYLAFSLYPLLLRGGNEDLPAITIEFLLLFSIPMAVGGAVLSQPILHEFGPNYAAGALGLSVLCAMFLFQALSNTVEQTLLGTEKVDISGGGGFRSIAKSNLLFVVVVDMSQALAYLASLYVVLWIAFSRGIGYGDAVGLWASVQLVTTVTFLAVKSRRARLSAKLFRGWRRPIYYLLSAGVMALAVSFLSRFILQPGAGTLVYGLQLCGLVGLGGAVYFASLYALDSGFRAMARAAVAR